MTGAGPPEPEVFGDYRAMLDSKSIDAVVISTPEHWHHLMVRDTLATNKDLSLSR